MGINDIIFWALLVAVTYSYFLYPLILMLLVKKDRSLISIPDSKIPVSIIITAHNEADKIRGKIENTLALDYTYGNLEILIASDGSTDSTNDIVSEYSDKGVILVDVQDRLGKENAQQQAINVSTGDIIVFSDAATILRPDAINILVSHFSTPDIGAVSSEDVFISEDSEIAGEGLYVKYEMWLRTLESNLAGLVGLSGSFFAARRKICLLWNKNTTSDFNTALNCAKLSCRAISAPDVKGYYKDLKNKKQEYQRKYRTVLRGITALWVNKTILNPFAYGLFSFQVWSHKVMRWLVPWFMILLLIYSVMLGQDSWLYFLILCLQIMFYLLSIIGYLSAAAQKKTIFKVPYFFITVNIAIAHASLAFIFGKRITVWAPSKR